MTYNIRETEPIETGFNWFDICFYTATIEKVFGSEYQTWTENPKVPKQLTDFFTSILKALYKIYPFELAMLDFEVSGQYYFDDLKKPINTWTYSAFFVGQNKYDLVAVENRKFVKTNGNKEWRPHNSLRQAPNRYPHSKYPKPKNALPIMVGRFF
jgi:hypothetical protein